MRKVEEGATASTSDNGGETQEHNENPDDYGVKEQSRVYSKFYGKGVVTGIVSGKIYVDFEGKKRILIIRMPSIMGGLLFDLWWRKNSIIDTECSQFYN